MNVSARRRMPARFLALFFAVGLLVSGSAAIVLAVSHDTSRTTADIAATAFTLTSGAVLVSFGLMPIAAWGRIAVRKRAVARQRNGSTKSFPQS